MLRLAGAIVVGLILCSPFALAQDSTPKIQVFAGYSYFRAGQGLLDDGVLDPPLQISQNSLGPTTNFINGVDGEVQYNITSALGVVADINDRRGNLLTARSGSGISSFPNENAYSFLFGPEVSYKFRPKITPFFHALFGVDDLQLDASTPKGLPNVSSTPALTNAAFAFALGGGVDYKFTSHVALRLAQVDYFRTTHNERTMYGTLFGQGFYQNLPLHQINARVSAGVVFRF